MLSQPALDDCGLTNMQLDLAIVAWNVDGLVSVLPGSGSRCCIVGAWLVTSLKNKGSKVKIMVK